MRQSQLFGKTVREAPRDEQSTNAKLLERGGFIYKNSAGVYSFLPLGWRVFQKIAGIIREEMNAIGGQELLMPSLVEKKYMEPTGRWDVPIGLEVRGKDEEKASFVLGWSHEEVLAAIAHRQISSYKDLPFAAYQIQTKFRNEPRAKSGILRGREFVMKDLYSFHTDEKDFEHYYEKVKQAYFRIFKRCGLDVIYTVAAGGVFTARFTHEFQVVAPVGEDTIFVCSKCGYAENQEISKLSAHGGSQPKADEPRAHASGGKENNTCPKCGGSIEEKKSIEVGNIFPLGTKYSDALGLMFVDEKGNKKSVVMGSYGIGLGRAMGTIVEVHHDDRGIMWPESVAPYRVHLVYLPSDEKQVKKTAEKFYTTLLAKGVEVLYDDREEKSAGEKFADADLIGIPWRVVVSEKTLAKKGVEVRKRGETETEIISEAALLKKLQK